jgi:hypothetical protein
MKREIVELDDDLVAEAERLASKNGKTLSEAVEAALRDWVDAHGRRSLPSFVGMANVPTSWTQEELDRELIDGLDPYEGWSPDRSGLRERGADPPLPREPR